MSSHELLKMLGDGAVFVQDKHHTRARRQERKSVPSIDFFAATDTSSAAKRSRDSITAASRSDDVMDSPSTRGINAHSDDDSKSHTFELFHRNGEPTAQSRFARDRKRAKSEGKKNPIHEEETSCFRRRLGIRVKGHDVADPIATFAEMPQGRDGADARNTHRVLLSNIELSTWKEPTPIQMQAIPILVAGRDLMAAAPTGSGKTAAFVLPVLLKLSARRDSKSGVRAVLLAPTRELAAQIHRDVLHLSKGRKIQVCLLTKSGVAKTAIASSDGRRTTLTGYDILVSTPMRLVTLLRVGALSLANVEMVILDEADKLFDTGSRGSGGDSAFVGQVDEVLAACSHKEVQRALFSATIGQQVRELATSILRDPILVTVGAENAGAKSIEQRLLYVGKEEGKLLAMRQLVQDGLRPPVLVFLQSKDRAKDLFHEMVYDGVNVDVIHAGRTQEQRDRIIERFRTGEIWVLICTDLMSRGIDFKGVNMVINYDFPQSAVSYIHRIGRTGRADRHGTAVTLFTEEDMESLRSIANVMRLSGCQVPQWMLSMKMRKGGRHKNSRAPGRDKISTVSKFDMHLARNRRKASGQRRVKNAEGTGPEEK